MIKKEFFPNKAIAFLTFISFACITFAARTDKRERNERIKKNQNYLCGGCGTDCRLEVHHIIPISLGGTNDDSNLIALGASIIEGGCGCHDKWDRKALK